MTVRLADLRRFAVSRSLFPLTSLEDALKTLGFLQADPIRAPARAQDLVLRHRVTGYRAGDLEHRYPGLEIEEDYFINYGFVTTSVHALMHPRAGMKPWPRARTKQAKAVLDFVGEQGVVHPREVNDHFLHGPVTNYWGGTSNATTHLLDSMHYRGLLRVAGRVNGIRTYAVQGSAPAKAGRSDRNTRIDALVDVLVGKYAPLTGAGLSTVVSRLRYCVPQ
ncbi:MAG: winged helix DNA-binding domain-containing protein, partial [Bryobacteraceae bacterium]|nr:winged helix DNA-binding domain-containing protein [Bryobacteraceae bacterium]